MGFSCSKSKRYAIYHRDGGCCIYCRRRVFLGLGNCADAAANLDHVVARSLGGSNRPSNLVLSCRQCNLAKSALTCAQWDAKASALGIDTTAMWARVNTARTTSIRHLRKLYRNADARQALVDRVNLACAAALQGIAP